MNYEDHCIGLGKLWGDLQGLEVTLRIFLTHCSTTYQSMSCQSALNWAPLSASKRDPFERRVLAVALAPSELAGVAATARARAGT